MLNSGNNGVIRHIQRGYINNADTSLITLNGFSNLNKMIVIVNGFDWKYYNSADKSYKPYPAYIRELTLTSLTITGTKYCYYQVIEFY